MKLRVSVLAFTLLSAGWGIAQNTSPTSTPSAPNSTVVAATTTASAPPAAVAIPAAPVPKGTAWIVMDFASGQVLAGENIHTQLEPASITKVMTAYVLASEQANGKITQDDQVLLSERAWREGGARTDGSYSGFELNQRARLGDMEKGMAVQSGNDAAIALAEHVAGTQEAFATLMNNHAAQIGMTNSHFANAHGLSAPGHLSTAYDLALLGRALIRDFPETYAYNKIKEFQVGNIKQPNRNLLLWRDPSVDGIKTGHHSGAGYCLMSSAQRDQQRLITVVMGSTSEKQRAQDSQALLEWGFKFFETHRLYEPNVEITNQRVWKGRSNEVQLGVAQPFLVSMARGRFSELKPMIEVQKQLVAPIQKGQQVGSIKMMLDQKVIAEAPLIAIQGVEEGGFFKRLWDGIRLWWSS